MVDSCIIEYEMKRLVGRAEEALEELQGGYEEQLGEDLMRLRKFAEEEHYQAAAALAYRIKGAAGTLGWPLISVAANFLGHVIRSLDQTSKGQDALRVHLDTIDLIYAERLKGEHPKGRVLVRELAAVLVKYDIEPGE